MRKTAFIFLSLPIGFALTAGIIWLFDINLASAQHWARFPQGWRLYDLVTNAAALLILFGAVRAAYQVLNEIWGDKTGKQTINDDTEDPATKA